VEVLLVFPLEATLARIAAAVYRRPFTILLGITMFVLLAGTASPAMGGPTIAQAGAGAMAKAKRALNLAKQADRRSRLALSRAGTPGPQGAPGPRGAEGFDGQDGARGPKGATGPQGAGAKGATGAQGAIGPAGAVGPAGPAGPQGAAGPKGATGAQGAIGPAGAVGPPGPAGPQGAAGAKGATGSQGAVGPRGATGADGATGPAGPTASRTISKTSAVDISTSATVMDLSAAPLSVSFAGRLMATASVQVRNPSVDPREGRCKLQIIDAADPQATPVSMSQTYTFDIPPGPDFDTTVTVSGGATKPSGSYNVSLICWEGASQSLSAERANMQVWAAD